MNSDQSKRKNGRTKMWGRYRNLMLVGDQGEVIPFRRFKIMAYGLVSALIVLSIAVVVLGVLLTILRTPVKSKNIALKETQQQLVKLRDEKDLLLTQIVIDKKKNGTKFSEENTTKAPSSKPAMTVSKAVVPQPPKVPPAEASPKKTVAPKPPAPAPVKLSADARRIKVSYRPDRQLLSLSFRIYNTSKPKVPLTGRTVVVFRHQDDPPIHWLAVPRVQLVDGKPSGKRGKAFKINNYRTESFKAYRLKTPIRYNTATIFVYASNGELLLSKDYSFKIAEQPPPKPVIPAPKPVIPAPKPVEEKVVKPVPPVPSKPEVAPLPSAPAPVDPMSAGEASDEKRDTNSAPLPSSGPKIEGRTPEASPGIKPTDIQIPTNKEVTSDPEKVTLDGEQILPATIQSQPRTQGEQR